jgi:hypothetical protein
LPVQVDRTGVRESGAVAGVIAARVRAIARVSSNANVSIASVLIARVAHLGCVGGVAAAIHGKLMIAVAENGVAPDAGDCKGEENEEPEPHYQAPLS